MKSHYPSPGMLEITQSRAASAFGLLFMLLFFAAWYSFMIDQAGRSGVPSFLMLLLWSAPLFALPELIRQARVVAGGEKFTLNRATRVIERNGVRLADFSEIIRIQVRTIRDSESRALYRLSLILASENKIRIAHSFRLDEILDVAEDLADVLGVEITRKS